MNSSELLVLVVDDREENRYTIRHALTRAGMQTIEAATGREALEQSKCVPDAIILDIRLPDMLGYEVCRRLRANPKTSHVPVLQLSAAFLTTESKLYALESGADAYLAQPADPLLLVGTIRSLIRLREAERTSQMAARHWAATFDALSEGVALVDGGTIRRCNRAMTTLLNLPYGNLEGLRLEELVHGYFGVELRPAQAIAATVVQRHEKFFRLEISPLPDNDGTPGQVFIVADVTAQKQAEQALLLNERLAATGRMAHTIAHEINNPLEAITNLIYLAQRASENDSDTKAYLASAAEEVERISQITRQILSFNREAATAVTIKISDLVADVLALSARNGPEKNVVTSLESDPTLLIKGFPARLRQAFSNLIRNAIEASAPDGTIRVRVSRSRLQRESGGIPAVRISIADQGSGILPQHRDKIFQAFYTTKFQKGSGIGLWLTLAVVQEHQGTLRMRTAVDSPRHGSTFSVLLPLYEEAGGPATDVSALAHWSNGEP